MSRDTPEGEHGGLTAVLFARWEDAPLIFLIPGRGCLLYGKRIIPRVPDRGAGSMVISDSWFWMKIPEMARPRPEPPVYPPGREERSFFLFKNLVGHALSLVTYPRGDTPTEIVISLVPAGMALLEA